MSWLQPSDDDKNFVAGLVAKNQTLYHVLRVLALASHIEPLLLRNARLAYAPQSDIELETVIWFYEDIIQSRNALGLVMYGGIARALVDRFEQDDTSAYKHAKTFVENHTRHWQPRDRLEQLLRWYARENKQGELRNGLQQLLYTLTRVTNPEKRREFARWIGGALPQLIKADNTAPEEAHWLNYYVSAVFGSSGKQISPTEENTTTIPSWLTNQLPSGEINHMGLQLYSNGLECLPADQADHVISIALPLPTPVLLETEPNGKKQWQGLWSGHKIPLEPPLSSVTLQTLDGKRYRLKALEKIDTKDDSEPDLSKVLQLVYMPEDREHATSISSWLSKQGFNTELVQQSQESTDSEPSQTPVLHLWTHNAARYWQNKSIEDKSSPAGVLLRTDAQAELPFGFSDSTATVLDLPGWRGEEKFADADQLLNTVNALLSGELQNEEGKKKKPSIESLLAEINDPKTTPSRRLEIGDILADMGDTRSGVGLAEYSVEPQYAPEVTALLEKIASLKTEPPTRLEIGDKLAELGDPRPGVSLDENGLPDIDWVEIPGGEFIYGEAKTQQTLRLETFYMARYPVSNMQYQAFIDAGAYKDKRWWQDLENPEPEKSTWQQPNRPRTDVDWYEAVAFCRWLSAQLGYEVRLPTEQEWEKAARGTDGREYPWGNDYQAGFANVDETKNNDGPWDIKQTIAVGVYAHGVSPDGVEDMAGNVWEWCLNKYENPKDTAVDRGGERRVLRGGSWIDDPDYARAAYRYWDLPVVRYDSYGFRLLSSLPLL